VEEAEVKMKSYFLEGEEETKEYEERKEKEYEALQKDWSEGKTYSQQKQKELLSKSKQHKKQKEQIVQKGKELALLLMAAHTRRKVSEEDSSRRSKSQSPCMKEKKENVVKHGDYTITLKSRKYPDNFVYSESPHFFNFI
jgi:hypothetical protein